MSSPSSFAAARRKSVRPRPNAAAFFIASLLLHVAALAAVSLQPGKEADTVKWRLLINQGRESAPLSASVARPTPKPARDVPIRIEKTAPVKQAIAEQPPASLVGGAIHVSRRETELPRKPDGVVPQLAQGRPTWSVRADAGAAMEPPSSPADILQPTARPRRAFAVALDLAASEPVVVESVASVPSKSDSGAVNGVPKLISGVPPAYPPESERLGETGTVKLRIRVDRRGNVVAAAVHQSSGFVRLDQAALRAIRLWKFEPIDDSAHKAPEFVWRFQFRDRQSKPATELMPTSTVR